MIKDLLDFHHKGRRKGEEGSRIVGRNKELFNKISFSSSSLSSFEVVESSECWDFLKNALIMRGDFDQSCPGVYKFFFFLFF